MMDENQIQPGTPDAPDTGAPTATAEPPEEKPAKKSKPKKGKKPKKAFSLPKKGRKNADSDNSDDPAQAPGGKPRRRGLLGLGRRKVTKNQIIRIEDLEDALANGQSVDPDAIVSMYMPRRRVRRFAEVLLNTSKLQLVLLCLLLGVAGLFIISFMQEKMGNFTINLNRLELYRKGISISENGEFTNPTARLTANAVTEATNISINDLPENIDEIEGDHNGASYMAYTYYVRNAGKVDVAYVAAITLQASAKGADKAVRVAVWRNGVRTVYAAPAANGQPESGCVNFASDTLVCEYDDALFRVGDVDKYTIVIWMEGDDPECVDDIVGGSVQFAMNIDTAGGDDTNLLVKFVQDIMDTLSGNQPINAAGTDAPDYVNNGNITWQTRRNQGEEEAEPEAETEDPALTALRKDLTPLDDGDRQHTIPGGYEGAIIAKKSGSTLTVLLTDTDKMLEIETGAVSLRSYHVDDYIAIHYTMQTSTIGAHLYATIRASSDLQLLAAAADR